MTKLKASLVAAAIAALTLLPSHAMASCPDPDNPCTPQTIDVWAEICARAPKLPKCSA